MAPYKDFGETAEYYGWGAVPDAWGAMGDAMAAPGSAIWDFLGQAATGFPGNAPTPGFDQLTGSEMDREWGWTAPPALGGGGGAGRHRPYLPPLGRVTARAPLGHSGAVTARARPALWVPPRRFRMPTKVAVSGVGWGTRLAVLPIGLAALPTGSAKCGTALNG